MQWSGELLSASPRQRRRAGFRTERYGTRLTSGTRRTLEARGLTDESEAAIVNTLDTMATWKVPLTAFDLRCVVKGYLDRQGVVDARFRYNLPGPDWVKSFIGRHNLTTRCADNVRPVRAEISPRRTLITLASRQRASHRPTFVTMMRRILQTTQVF